MPSAEMGNLPRYAIYRGRKVRIMRYDSFEHPNRPFQIVDTDDSTPWVPREALTFV